MGIFTKKRKVKVIFVGSYGNDFTRGLYVFHLDIENGELIKKKYYPTLSHPTCLYRQERYIYVCYKNATGKANDGGIWQYASMDMQLGLIAKVSNHGKAYQHCFVNRERTYVYAVDYYHGEVVTIPIVKQKIMRVTQTLVHIGKGLDVKRQSEAHPCYIEETSDHQRILVCDLGMDEVVVYKVIDNGKLEKDPKNTIILKPGSGPKKIVFAPNGTYAYVLNELSNTVCVYYYSNCHFEFIQEMDIYRKDEYSNVNLASDLMISDDGKYLFVSCCGYDCISVFEIDEEGRLCFIETVDTDENPQAMILLDNRFLVVASKKAGSLETFEIRKNESKGVLFETHYRYMIDEPVCLLEGRGI